MAAEDAILAIDQGTTSTRAIVFSKSGQILALAQEALPQIYPADGWVEHDPEEIFRATISVATAAIEEAKTKGASPRAIGLTNQRETVVVWDKKTGRPIHNAIVWQDRRTADICAGLVKEGAEPEVRERSGLLVDPYFSATKLAWILDHVDGARARAEAGEFLAGTVDSFLIWRLTDGAVHATDATNACRTNLFGLQSQEWDDHLCQVFRVPKQMLPQVKDCAADFGTATALPGALPITGVAGDQQAAAVGQACFTPGSLKSTYGTGCFVIVNTGKERIRSENRLLSTVCYRLGGEVTYAVEGSIFIAGAAVQWLRDEVGVLKNAAETAERAARTAPDARVIMVPAFTGMGAPHWSPHARAAVFGMTRSTGPDELARAALEGVIYQTYDLFEAMRQDGIEAATLRIDGGMAANDWFAQRLADILARPVDRPTILETTALGAAYLAGLEAGVYGSLDEVAAAWSLADRREPALGETERRALLRRWQACVEAVLKVAAVA